MSTGRTPVHGGDGSGFGEWWRSRVDALRARDDVQLAAVMQARGVVDAVRFLAGSPDERAIWLAALEWTVEWEREANSQ